jgi:branched-chain amino acid aminotransferase
LSIRSKASIIAGFFVPKIYRLIVILLFLKYKGMVNFNGDLISEKKVQLSSENRGFKYGDAIFETIKVERGKIVFWEDHYFRLMASMRMLRMKIPMQFTLEFLEQEILKTVAAQEAFPSFRVRFNVFRKDGGLYTPKTNKVSYLIDVKANSYQTKETYSVDVFKDFYSYSGLLSTIKSNNRMSGFDPLSIFSNASFPSVAVCISKPAF